MFFPLHFWGVNNMYQLLVLGIRGEFLHPWRKGDLKVSEKRVQVLVSSLYLSRIAEGGQNQENVISSSQRPLSSSIKIDSSVLRHIDARSTQSSLK